MDKTEKNWKENHSTKVTKIPKTKRRKYGMNETLCNMSIKFLPKNDLGFPNPLEKVRMESIWWLSLGDS